MNRNAIALTLVTLNFAIGATVSPARAGGDKEIWDLQPFTHLARIPADADKGTIRFEGAKMVQVPARITSTRNSGYCQELASRDPGGSMFCPDMRTESTVTAYEITYSYIGTPLASDESGNRKFTSQVYFRPDELASEVRQALSERKRDRGDLAGYFTVNVLREPVERVAIDETRSHFCAGNYVDGIWTHNDASCKDEIVTKAIAGLSDYITVRVDPAPARTRLVSATQGGPSTGSK